MRFAGGEAIEEAFIRVLSIGIAQEGVIQISGATAFVIGSVFFLPNMSPELYLCGVNLFMGASLALCALALKDLREACRSGRSAQPAIVSLYVIGLLLYVGGTAFFYPSVSALEGATDAGAYLFVLGSIVLLAACVANIAYIGIESGRQAKSGQNRGATVATLLIHTCLMLLCMAAFLVGSVLYIHRIGCDAMAPTVGTWAYIVGSVLNLFATLLQLRSKNAFQPWLATMRTPLNKWPNLRSLARLPVGTARRLPVEQPHTALMSGAGGVPAGQQPSDAPPPTRRKQNSAPRLHGSGGSGAIVGCSDCSGLSRGSCSCPVVPESSSEMEQPERVGAAG